MSETDPDLNLETMLARAAHLGELGGARPTAVPIHNSSSFYFDSSAELDKAFDGAGYVYSRFANPTVAALEATVARLESTDGAVAFASGMAAIHAAILALVRGPDNVLLASRDCYGGTQALLVGPLAEIGLRTSFVDLEDEAALELALAERPQVVLVETVSNPLLRLADIPRLAERAHAVGARLVVDSTFTTPMLCRPLRDGADLVIHSATKYLGGHGDVTAGVAAGRQELLEPLRRIARLTGGVLGPNEAWLVLRGLKTLALRVNRQCASALSLARWLERHPRVSRVYYPGLASHPQHELARQRLQGGYGGVVSFDLQPPSATAATAFIDRLRLFTPAATMGDLESLVMYPARASHRGLTPEQRRVVGIGDGLIRLSVGIEAVDDLQSDLERALQA